MADVRAAAIHGDLSFIEPERLQEWVVAQRWFASKSKQVTGIDVLQGVPLRQEEPFLVLAMVSAKFHAGTHELYQLPVGIRPASDSWSDAVIDEVDGWTAYDGLTDPVHAREILGRMHDSSVARAGGSTLSFFWADGAQPPAEPEVRPMGVEQSNSSMVFSDELILKTFRRVEPGVNPELELLRFLTSHEFKNIAPLAGWYEYGGRLVESTLGILQAFMAGAVDGWELALDELANAPDRFLQRLAALGEVTGRMHTVLGSDAGDPAFAPEADDVAQRKRLSLTGRKPLDEDHQVRVGQPAEHVVGHLGRRRLAAQRHAIRLLDRHPLVLAQVVEGLVAGYPVQPAAEGSPQAQLERRQRLERLRERLLSGVLCLVVVAQQQAQVAPDAVEVALVQGREGRQIAGLEARDQAGRLGVLDPIAALLKTVDEGDLVRVAAHAPRQRSRVDGDRHATPVEHPPAGLAAHAAPIAICGQPAERFRTTGLPAALDAAALDDHGYLRVIREVPLDQVEKACLERSRNKAERAADRPAPTSAQTLTGRLIGPLALENQCCFQTARSPCQANLERGTVPETGDIRQCPGWGSGVPAGQVPGA